MLHCASTALVVRPLALEAGLLPASATGVGVAQTQGCVCEPSRTGPPRAWLVIFRLAHGRPLPWPLESATSVFSPTTRPVTTPRKVRALSSATNDAPTSVPFNVSVTFFIGTVFGTCTSTRASPLLIRSARFDSVRISKLNGGRLGWAAAGAAAGFSAPPPPHPASISRAVMGAARHAARRAWVIMCLLVAQSLRLECGSVNDIEDAPSRGANGKYPGVARGEHLRDSRKRSRRTGSGLSGPGNGGRAPSARRCGRARRPRPSRS